MIKESFRTALFLKRVDFCSQRDFFAIKREFLAMCGMHGVIKRVFPIWQPP